MNAVLEDTAPKWAVVNTTYAAPLLRILVVIDGRVQLNRNSFRFGLGYALDTLKQMPSIVNVAVGIATREPEISDDFRGGHDVQYTGFKFTQAGFNLDQWDQVWLFGDQPNFDDGGASDNEERIHGFYELTDEEVCLLAKWMDRGGGVLAVGDHSILGASLCHRIPRVRTMRRWTHEDGVPENHGPTRNQTLQGGNNGDETDTVLQSVELAHLQSVNNLPFGAVARPHPLMCTKYGAIQHFPDHMHEGEVVPENEVVLSRRTEIPGYDRPEYPTAIPTSMPFASGDTGTISHQPRPEVIAYGRTTNPFVEPNLPTTNTNANALFRSLPPANKRFGLVSVYDGAQANVGRVVCDSTWHHWFSYNLSGIAAAGNTDFARMLAYYRNVALWLAGPQKLQMITLHAVWTMMMLPMAFSGRRTVWEMGERATAMLNEWMSPCWVNELVGAQFNASSLFMMATPEDSPNEGPTWGGLPEAVVHRAVLGTLCVELLPIAHDVQRKQGLHDHVKVDGKELLVAAAKARAAVPQVLDTCIKNAAEAYTALGKRWSAAMRQQEKVKNG